MSDPTTDRLEVEIKHLKNCVASLRSDKARLDWLATQDIEARAKGSMNLWYVSNSPDADLTPLRKQIDNAMEIEAPLART